MNISYICGTASSRFERVNEWKEEIALLVRVMEGNSIPASPALLTLGAGGGRQLLHLMTSADKSILPENTVVVFTFVYSLYHLRVSLKSFFLMILCSFDFKKIFSSWNNSS